MCQSDMFGIEVGRTAELDDLQAIRAIDKADMQHSLPGGVLVGVDQIGQAALHCSTQFPLDLVVVVHQVASLSVGTMTQIRFQGAARLPNNL